MVWNMVDNKVILIQVWIGKIPDYFWYHYETTKNLVGYDFLFVTDQTDLVLDAKNYKVIYRTKENIELLLSNKTNSEIKLSNNKKICDAKISYGDLFEEYILDYEYFGCYDIDTLFGDLSNIEFGDYDFISFADKKYYNRLAGPFILVKNTEKLRKLYLDEDFINCMNQDNVICYEENIFYNKNKYDYKINLIYDRINCNHNGKNVYDCIWSGGKLLSDNKEISLYHFYRKDKTKFNFVGNKIIAKYDKKLVDDFYWVVGFTENYSKLSYGLLDSIKKYSNRKCIIYTINFDFQLPEIYSTSNQFILRRIDIPKGNLDNKGRDENIINSKPLINLDVINYLPNKTFIFLDCDIYLTVNCDELKKYFQDLEHYPLINSHVHDKIFVSDIIQNEWVSTIDILSEATGIPVTVFPRRKTNVLIFDDKSKWFFEEQMMLYNQYKDTRHGIFRLHDEDSANIILSKYNLTKSLPLIDIEESFNVEIEKIKNYSYSMSILSDNLVLPKNENDIYCFHGFKKDIDYYKINEEYSKTVLDCEDFIVTYENNTIKIEKNSFLTSKKIATEVDFIIKNIETNDIICQINNQLIFNYYLFYYSNIYIPKGKYQTQIIESVSSRIIFSDVIEIK